MIGTKAKTRRVTGGRIVKAAHLRRIATEIDREAWYVERQMPSAACVEAKRLRQYANSVRAIADWLRPRKLHRGKHARA